MDDPPRQSSLTPKGVLIVSIPIEPVTNKYALILYSYHELRRNLRMLVNHCTIGKGFIAFWAPASPCKQAAPLTTPPHAVRRHQGARVASQRCPILPNGGGIIPVYAVALKR